MNCHECARDDIAQVAIAECRFCHVGLCKAHLVASYQNTIIPQYACSHHPERPFARATPPPAPQPTAVRE
ncbi:MAG: DUF2180 family protein [Candidatus Limnocylindria bacterium]